MVEGAVQRCVFSVYGTITRMKAVPGDVASLFRVVDASDVEKTVLRDAERRVRDATIPRFTVASGLGYGPASLGNFCADVDSLVLRMAADAARREGQQLRESGVANLAARDRVRLVSYQLRFLSVAPVRCGQTHKTTRSDCRNLAYSINRFVS